LDVVGLPEQPHRAIKRLKPNIFFMLAGSVE
jgi:hypothetical protein